MNKERHTVELADGRRVKFAIAPRSDEPHYFVYFRGLDGRRLERSTKEESRKRALEAAIQIVKEEYSPRPAGEGATWDEAAAAMVRAMKAKNLRDRTIGDYKLMLANLRKVYPSSRGPDAITPALAKMFKTRRMEAGLTACTVAGNINKLSVIWSKWFIEECEFLAANPWEDVEQPKVDEPEPRYIEPEEQQAFFDWLEKRWNGWRLPVLFFLVKGLVGRRILQLASLPSICLKDGRLVFVSETNKGRRMEYARLPPDIYEELVGLAGPTHLWERYSEQLRTINRAKGRKGNTKEFMPERLRRFIQNEVSAYNQENDGRPGFVPFTAHNFRDTAMTRAWDAGIDLDRAALAYGCNRETMKKHYIRKNALAVADAVLEQVQSQSPKPAKNESGGMARNEAG